MRVGFWIFVVAWLAWHLFTLDKNPLPWYDETYFASVSNSLLNQGQLIPTVVYSVNNHQPVYHYGPFYFLLGSWSFKCLGFGIFQFRLVNFIFGIGLLWISFQLMNQWISNRWVPLLGTVLLSLDPFFSLCLHEGRMDIMVCFFSISSFYLLQDSSNPVRFWSASVLLGIGLLTSSRAIFYFPAFVLFLLLNGDSPKDVFLWLLVASMPVLGWLVFSFDSLDHLLAYVSHKNSEESLGYFFNMHWPLYVPVHLFLVLSMGLVIGLLALYLNPSALLEKNKVFCFGVVLGYYILVVDYGPYSIFIIPYLYLILLKLGQDLDKWPVISIALLLFSFNTAYFSLKSVQVLSSWDIRNPSFLEERIKTRIPSGSKVVGDALLYYAVERSNCKFQYIDHFGNDVGVREKILINDFDFEYLILSDQYMKRSFADAQYLIQSGRYELVEKVIYDPQTVSSSILPLWALSQLENSTGYNCTIFRRKK